MKAYQLEFNAKDGDQWGRFITTRTQGAEREDYSPQ